MSKKITGYKVFDPYWECKGFQYEVGKTYHARGKIRCYINGFHFCMRLVDCFKYYNFDPNNKVAIVEASGSIDKDDDVACASVITIVQELSWFDVLRMLNVGNYNAGRNNVGDFNSGHYNSGNFNTGCCNMGDGNSGESNYGNYNSGGDNYGDYNSGEENYGDSNSGNGNSGSNNSGDYNSGKHNAGDWNIGNGNTGAFNTISPEILLFNKPSGWTYDEWHQSIAYNIMRKAPRRRVKWILEGEMTSEEKRCHPEYETTGGCLREISKEKLFQERQQWWDEKLPYKAKVAVMSLPNFDPSIFEACTGIKVE